MFGAFAQQYTERANRAIEQWLPNDSNEPKRLHRAMRYSALNPGKRMRPLLVYATGQVFNVSPDKLDPLAAAVELIHAYSLIHDDLPCMDDDDLRRGKPTCHIKFDEATAVLAGDALQSLAFDVLIQNHKQTSSSIALKMLHLLSHASGSLGMGGGQALDLAATGNDLSMAQLAQIHQMKTGALIEAAVLLGYLASERNESSEINSLKNFSQAIGLAFQIKDDILDVTGTTEDLGKPQGSDIGANKATYPAILGLEGANKEAEKQYHLALAALGELPYNTQLLKQFAQFIVERDR